MDMVFVIGGITVAVAIAVGGFFFLQNRKKNQEKEEAKRRVVIDESKITDAPAGWLEFCRKYPDFPGAEWQQDRPRPEALIPEETDDVWDQLVDVQNDVNNAIDYRTDQQQYDKPEYWTPVSNGYGDCEDYAIEKKAALVDLGFPAHALRFATCWTETGEYHAVLLAETSKGTYVLDNRAWNVRNFDDMPYRWHKREVPGERFWFEF